MRLQVSRKVRVFPGDFVVVRASLKPPSGLGRLFVFARAKEDETFSPYVVGLGTKLNADPPPMLQPLSLRIDVRRPSRTCRIVSDLDGWLCVMQEVDNAREVRAKVKMSLQPDPSLAWPRRAIRKVAGWLS